MAWRIEWDDRKRASNLKKHDLDFSDVVELLAGHHFMWADTREDYEEERWNAVGEIKGRTVIASFTFRGPQWIRLFSLRGATRREREAYQTGFQD